MIKTILPKHVILIYILLFATIAGAQNLAINEVMASNASAIVDDDGSFEDWIEIYNYGAAPVSLNGYGLTDNPAVPYKWVFPDVTLGAGEFVLVWASDKNRAVAGQPLHANFKISTDGETIALKFFYRT